MSEMPLLPIIFLPSCSMITTIGYGLNLLWVPWMTASPWRLDRQARR